MPRLDEVERLWAPAPAPARIQAIAACDPAAVYASDPDRHLGGPHQPTTPPADQPPPLVLSSVTETIAVRAIAVSRSSGEAGAGGRAPATQRIETRAQSDRDDETGGRDERARRAPGVRAGSHTATIPTTDSTAVHVPPRQRARAAASGRRAGIHERTGAGASDDECSPLRRDVADRTRSETERRIRQGKCQSRRRIVHHPNCCSTTTVASRPRLRSATGSMRTSRAQRARLHEQRRGPVDPLLEQIRSTAGPGGRRGERVVHGDSGLTGLFRRERGLHHFEKTSCRNLTARGGLDQRAIGHDPSGDTAEAVGAGGEPLAQPAGDPRDGRLLRRAEADTLGHPTGDRHDDGSSEPGACDAPRGV